MTKVQKKVPEYIHFKKLNLQIMVFNVFVMQNRLKNDF